MMCGRRVIASVLILVGCGVSTWASDGNRLAYLDDLGNPYYVGRSMAKLTTPQWIGEPGVKAAVVLSIDDMNTPERYEAFLRPILDHLKQIDGRAPVSIMTTHVDPSHPRLQSWLQEGVSIEAHTYDHPCPCLQGGELAKAKSTYDRSVDLLSTIPNTAPVAFRMPCCDSMNSMSPRVFAEILARTTPQGRFLSLDSSIFVLFTPADSHLPRPLVFEDDGRQRFSKYVPRNKDFTNYVENYPFPFVVDRLIWELPSPLPDDWQGHNLQGPHHANTLRDMKAALDATILKQGVFTLTFHPGAWIRNDQVVELIDHATAGRKGEVKFLNFREVLERLTANALGGQALRTEDGRDNGVRLLDANNDGYLDVVIGNENVHQTRVWSPETKQWQIGDFPVEIVTADGDAGVRFGVLSEDGHATFLVHNERTAGLWHFRDGAWVRQPEGLAGLDAGGEIYTSLAARDRGVRLRDLNGDGVCELMVANPDQSAVFQWRADRRRWVSLPFALPAGTSLVDEQGRDAGLRLVDLDVDTHLDLVFSNAERYSVHRYVSFAAGWAQTMISGPHGGELDIPAIVRADGTNNGVWFKQNHMWVQNEDTGGRLPNQVDKRHYTELLGTDRNPPPRSPKESLGSFELLPGFQIELAAAEPLVMDPVDIAWGPDGKAWVVEYADYPLGLDDHGRPGGRIRCLEDTDGDGRYDQSTIFLEPVASPMGVLVWRKGIVVTAAPEVFYAEDTDGDGRADRTETLFSGFREGNQQHRVNHPRWGLDNWVHAANGDSGGTIRSLKTGQQVNINGRDLRFRPDEGLLEPQSGQTQFGTNRDDWGNWFGCNNSNPGWLYVMADHYLRRNPHFAPPAGRVDVTPDRIVYPVGRVLSHCDLKHRPHAAWGKPGRWTSVAGVTIYRDEFFGPHFQGNLFVDDSVFNVVHRRILKPTGLTFRGERGPDEQQSEFLASHDIWFRPSSVETGPDGALWVLDMYRFVIEHPEWIHDDLEKTLELRAGHDCGRIYRIFPVGRRPRPIPRLDRLDTAGLVAAMDSPNGWQRDMAHQMLLWNADAAAVEPLEDLIRNARRPQARMHALCVLDGLRRLTPMTALHALKDPHPGVRRHAVRVSEALLSANSHLGEALLELSRDPDPHVRMQVAYSLGEWDDPEAGAALGRMAIESLVDPYLFAAVMSSASPHIDAMVAEVVANREHFSDRPALLAALMGTAVGMEDPVAMARILGAVAEKPSTGFAPWQFEAMARLLDGLGARNSGLEGLASQPSNTLADALAQTAELFVAAR
ncbi:MAG: PVC-type heme-binding CxxCH protein, partial [Pirellulales bacterium]